MIKARLFCSGHSWDDQTRLILQRTLVGSVAMYLEILHSMIQDRRGMNGCIRRFMDGPAWRASERVSIGEKWSLLPSGNRHGYCMVRSIRLGVTELVGFSDAPNQEPL